MILDACIAKPLLTGFGIDHSLNGCGKYDGGRSLLILTGSAIGKICCTFFLGEGDIVPPNSN